MAVYAKGEKVLLYGLAYEAAEDLADGDLIVIDTEGLAWKSTTERREAARLRPKGNLAYLHQGEAVIPAQSSTPTGRSATPFLDGFIKGQLIGIIFSAGVGVGYLLARII